uniref:Uncharacterized protein n=1 Tax=Arundo donax TaxID=35708 RepID=A0A0A8ZA34_ARUDO
MSRRSIVCKFRVTNSLSILSYFVVFLVTRQSRVV